jgi:hypothetical protein
MFHSYVANYQRLSIIFRMKITITMARRLAKIPLFRP